MTKGNLGKVGKISNFGAVGDGSDKGNLGKIGKISNFGAVGDGSDKDGIRQNDYFMHHNFDVYPCHCRRLRHQNY